MECRDLIIVGGSAGSLAPLRSLVHGLPADLPATVAVSIHISSHARSRLPWLLSRAGPLPAKHGETGHPLSYGEILIAPPGRHMLVTQGVVELSPGPRVNRCRPAVDVMFASAARWFGDRVVAVILSGMLDDGAVGAALVAQAGGLVVVQEPEDAEHPSMPLATLAAAPGAIPVPSSKLGQVVTEMVGETGLVTWPSPARPPELEVTMEETSDLQFLDADETRLTRLVCPECGGALAETVLPQITYYRCHVGHQFAPQSLAAAQEDSAEAKLWSAVAALEETAALSRHLADHETGYGRGRQRATADWATSLAESVRSQMHTNEPPPAHNEA